MINITAKKVYWEDRGQTCKPCKLNLPCKYSSRFSKSDTELSSTKHFDYILAVQLFDNFWTLTSLRATAAEFSIITITP